MIVVGPFHSHAVATIGTAIPVKATAGLTVLLVLSAFAAGCSAVTGVEAIANGVPVFREPRVRTAQRTEISLGVLLASDAGRPRDPDPRPSRRASRQRDRARLGDRGAFGTGWPFYVSNLAVTAVLAFAANTSFGGCRC